MAIRKRLTKPKPTEPTYVPIDETHVCRHKGIQYKLPQPARGLTHQCPKCRGFGAWNYVMHRSIGSMSQQGCDQCHGEGFVDPSGPDAECVHEWTNPEVIGRCLAEWSCAKCPAKKTVDSS